jgi:hypothetical protein
MTRTPPRVTLRVARGQAAQQQAIDAWVRGESLPAAVIAEGAFFELTAPLGVAVARLAAGCVCCVGLVPLRVTLTRLLRAHKPARMLLLIADASHIDRVRALLEGGESGVSLEVAE